jgi:hypothetical protein
MPTDNFINKIQLFSKPVTKQHIEFKVRCWYIDKKHRTLNSICCSSSLIENFKKEFLMSLKDLDDYGAVRLEPSHRRSLQFCIYTVHNLSCTGRTHDTNHKTQGTDREEDHIWWCARQSHDIGSDVLIKHNFIIITVKAYFLLEQVTINCCITL